MSENKMTSQCNVIEVQDAVVLSGEKELKQEILELKQLILDQNKEIEKIRKLEKSDKTRTALVFVLVFAILISLATFLPKVSKQLDNIQDMISDTTTQVSEIAGQVQDKFDELNSKISESDLEAVDELLNELPELTKTIKSVQSTLSPLVNFFGR